MRLSRQISLLVTMLMLLVLLVTVYISIHASRQYLLEQMRIQAQAAGSSLALTMTPILVAGEMTLAEAMLDSVFDRGNYQKIQIKAVDGKLLFERHRPITVQGVPVWFLDFAAVESPVVQSPVVNGVTRIAAVVVTPHPGKAYRALWKMTRSNITWITTLAAVGVVLIWMIVAYALRPLIQVKRQAEEIARQNYSLQTKFPFARELRQLVVAMNDMAETLEGLMAAQMDQVIELASQVHTDAGTGLLNRQGFDERFNQALKQNANLQGQILLIRISGLERLNQFFSFKRGNEELHKLLTRIKEISTSEWEIARLVGADMVVFIPDAQDCDIAQRCEQLVQALNATSEDLQCCIGGINITVGHDKESLLKQANQALQKALAAETRWYAADRL